MTLTAEECAEIRRQNGRKSRGPITDEGKERSRRNALKHGLRAEVLPLPDDDPEAVEARHEEWDDYYRPQSPAARHLVDRCVRATFLADRCDVYHHAALSQRIRRAEGDWEDEREGEVERAGALLDSDPAAAVRMLRRSGHGCRWLIARWEALGRSLEERGFWRPDERAEAIRLLGEHPEPLRTHPMPGLSAQLGLPEPERARYSATAFAIHLQSLSCQPDPPRAELKRVVEAGRTPYAFNDGRPPDRLLDPAASLAALRRIVADELEALRPREQRLRLEWDEPDRAEAGRRALLPPRADQSEARLFLRYHAEARTTFHRAYQELSRVLKADAHTPEADAERTAEDDPSGSAPPSEYDRIRARRRTWRIYLENMGWPNGETQTLQEFYRSAGLLYPHERDGDDVSPNEPKRAAAEISPNEPEPAGAEISPNEPEAVAEISPNEPEAAVSPNEPEPAAAVSPNEPEAVDASTIVPITASEVAAGEAVEGGAIPGVLMRVIEEMPGFRDAVRQLRDRAEYRAG